MSEQVDVLMTIPYPDELLEKLRNVSSRLHIQSVRASRVDEISSDLWAAAEVLYTGRIIPTPEVAPNLRWIQFHFAGIDHAREAPILAKEGFSATTMSGASASQVSEYILMMLLALGHHLPDMTEQQKKSNWPKDRWERFSPRELMGSTVGIVGYGSIGRQVARLLAPFGAQVLATKRDAMHPKDPGYSIEGQGDPAGDFVYRLYPAEAARTMAKECDFLVVTVPLTPRTRDLINAKVLDGMKESACIIDISRGGVLNHNDLVAALRDHRLAGAALDVFPEEPLSPDSPLWKMPNVLISPHISGNTPLYDVRAAELFAINLHRYLNGETLLNLVNIKEGY
jgi:phosphoglycerate dehydrogenase-like enzyme